jgi:hypothetical protein
VNADLMTGLDDGFHLLWERLERVAGNKPGGLNPKALKEREQARRSYLAREQPT